VFLAITLGMNFLLMTDHQLLKWIIESNKFIRNLTKWVLMLQEYDFKVVLIIMVNIGANRLHHNACLSHIDSMTARWHVGEDEEEVPRGHDSTSLAIWQQMETSVKIKLQLRQKLKPSMAPNSNQTSKL